MDLLIGTSRSTLVNTPQPSLRGQRQWFFPRTPQSTTPRSSRLYLMRSPSSQRSLPLPTLMLSDANGEESSLILAPDAEEAEQPAASKVPWHKIEPHLLAIKFVYFFVYANTACLIPYFVSYYYEWGLTATELALIQAAVPFFGFLIRPVIGRIADVTGYHRAVFAACCVWCGIFHVPHMFIPKLTPPARSQNCEPYCDNWPKNQSVIVNNPNSSFATTTVSATSTTTEESAIFSDPDRLPTLTLLLGLRLVAYAGQAPTQELADAFCYAATDRDPHKWGRQRIWSTIGWAIATFSVGYFLKALGSHYWLFVITAFFNFGAAISIAFLKPLNDSSPSSGPEATKKQKTNLSNLNISTSHMSTITSVDTRVISEPQITLMALLKQTHVQIYLLFSMLSGALLAVEFSFLLFFLMASGGDELLIGLHQVVDSLSEFPLFLFSGYIITWLGFVPCFCLSFVTYILRLISYSFLTDPLYLVLLVETVYCFSFTLYVAAGTGYADSITAPGLAATLQSVFQGVFFGLGIGAGNLVGGFLYPIIGARWLFRGAAVVAAICAASYAAIYYFGLLKGQQRPPPLSTITTATTDRLEPARRDTFLQSQSTDAGAEVGGKAFATDASITLGAEDSFDATASSSVLNRSTSVKKENLLPTPAPPARLYLSTSGLHRSPGAGRVAIPIMMTPLTTRILANDGFIRFIDE